LNGKRLSEQRVRQAQAKLVVVVVGEAAAAELAMAAAIEVRSDEGMPAHTTSLFQ
jgi:hypothetical protein